MTRETALNQAELLLSRIEFAVESKTQITFVVGAPISFDYTAGKGVPDVNGLIEKVREEYANKPSLREQLETILREPETNIYQQAFQFVHSTRGPTFANDIIRRSVLAAANDYSTDSGDPSNEKWHLAPAVDALGRILSKIPERFGSKIVTTNFDPLLEIAIDRYGGSSYSTFYHRDGNPSSTSAKGVNVIHLHGFWKNSDTLHTPQQLGQNRPALQKYLEELLRTTLVIFLAYGGWDDVLSAALSNVLGDESANPEILWAFLQNNKDSIATAEPQLFRNLHAGIARGRVQVYGGVDCHTFLPRLAGLLAGTGSGRPEQSLTDEERSLVSLKDHRLPRHVDAAPSIEGFLGRQDEISRINSSDAKVVCITGIGGQGKSALAAKLLTAVKSRKITDWRDCREESNTAQTALALFLEYISNGEITEEVSKGLSSRDLIDLILRHGAGKNVLLVLDNIDTYIDLESQRPVGIIGDLCERLLDSSVDIRVIITCRPNIAIPHARFFSMQLTGLNKETAASLFSSRSGGLLLGDVEQTALMRITDGHPLYVAMLAAQILSGGKSPTVLFSEVEASRSDVPALIIRSTFRLLKPDQTALLRMLAELERPESETSLEDISDLRYNKLSKALRRLKDLSLIVERHDSKGATLIDLHPLVRQFVRREFPRHERQSFIGRLILYFDRRLAVIYPQLGKRPIPRSVLDLWLHKIEIETNQENWTTAIDELFKIRNEVQDAGLGEEFIRLGIKILSGVNWETIVDESKDFRLLVSEILHELCYRGELEKLDHWVTHYESTLGSRGPDRLNALEIKGFAAWVQKDFEKSIELSRAAQDLSRIVDFNPPQSPLSNLALSLRDSGDFDQAMPLLLEGLTLDEAIQGAKGKGAPYFGNIGRCLQLQEKYDEALVLYRHCAEAMEVSKQTIHNKGWIRFWVGQTLIRKGRAFDGFALLCAAKHAWSKGSPTLEKEADREIEEILALGVLREHSLLEEWRAERLFRGWWDVKK